MPANSLIFQQTYSGYDIELTVGPVGQSVVRATSAVVEHVCEFQPIQFKPHTPVLIEIALVESELEALVNGLELKEFSASKSPLLITGKAREMIHYKRKYLNIDEAKAPNLRARRFIQMVKRLEADAIQGSEASVVAATASLRVLLVDGMCDRVNEKRIKLRYLVKPYEIRNPVDNDSIQLGFVYDWHSDNKQRLELSGADFRKKTLGRIYGTTFVVDDIIRLAANCLGGHHFGPAERTANQAASSLFDFYEDFRTVREPGFVRLMQQVLFCCLDGFEPLVASLLDRDQTN